MSASIQFLQSLMALARDTVPADLYPAVVTTAYRMGNGDLMEREERGRERGYIAQRWPLAHLAAEGELPVIPWAQGIRSDSYGESVLMWAVFSRTDVEAFLVALESNRLGSDLSISAPNNDDPYCDLGTALTGWYRYERGPGRWFAAAPWCKVTRTHVLVRQTRALDI